MTKTLRKPKSNPSSSQRSQDKQKMFKRNRTPVTDSELGSPLKSPTKKRSRTRSSTPPVPQADGVDGFMFRSPQKVKSGNSMPLEVDESVPRPSFNSRMKSCEKKVEAQDSQVDNIHSNTGSDGERNELMAPLILNNHHRYFTRLSKKTQQTVVETFSYDDEIHIQHVVSQQDVSQFGPNNTGAESTLSISTFIDEEIEFNHGHIVHDEVTVTTTAEHGNNYSLDLSDLCTEDADQSLLWVYETSKLKDTMKPSQFALKPSNTDKITLVLDLDECLVHSETDKSRFESYDHNFKVNFNKRDFDVYFKKRPSVVQFLKRVNELFEVVIFTASQKIYADKVLDLIDENHDWTSQRLYRDSCVLVNGVFVKDLRILGRDLSKVIIVDNAIEAFAFQIDNGVPIKSWLYDQEDKELLLLFPMLMNLRDQCLQDENFDVRHVLRREFTMTKRMQAAVASQNLVTDEN